MGSKRHRNRFPASIAGAREPGADQAPSELEVLEFHRGWAVPSGRPTTTLGLVSIWRGRMLMALELTPFKLGIGLTITNRRIMARLAWLSLELARRTA